MSLTNATSSSHCGQLRLFVWKRIIFSSCCDQSPPLSICARRNYPIAAGVCLKYGVKVCTPKYLNYKLFSELLNLPKIMHSLFIFAWSSHQGGGPALIVAANLGNISVVKVILQYWTGEDDMVRTIHPGKSLTKFSALAEGTPLHFIGAVQFVEMHLKYYTMKCPM